MLDNLPATKDNCIMNSRESVEDQLFWIRRASVYFIDVGTNHRFDQLKISLFTDVKPINLCLIQRNNTVIGRKVTCCGELFRSRNLEAVSILRDEDRDLWFWLIVEEIEFLFDCLLNSLLFFLYFFLWEIYRNDLSLKLELLALNWGLNVTKVVGWLRADNIFLIGIALSS